MRARPLARIALALGIAALAARASADVANPTLEGPIEGGSSTGAFIASTTFDLAQVGYEQAEYFISGTASAYTSPGPLGSDGMWTAAPGVTAAYKTRVLVYRPSNPKKFNGTVLVEWLNVSGGVDSAPDWIGAHTELTRQGFAWVGVSAQYTGVEGGGALLAVADLPLKKVAPQRYGSLVHPGDSFSYDMYSQAAQAVRHPTGASPLGPLKLKKMIAVGESQSAMRMVTYIDAIHPLTHLFDGYFVHSRPGTGALAGLSQAPQPNIPGPTPVQIRTDVDVPVLVFETESDLTFLDYFHARQPDGPNLRVWEVAGTAHADTYLTATGSADPGKNPAAVDIVLTTTPNVGISCGVPINSGPQHFVLNAAFAALNKWVRHGKAPKAAPPLDVAGGPPVAINADAHGNALGGIRTPQVDVPLATFTGYQPGPLICQILGTTTPFDAPTLAQLYPTHAAYVRAVGKAAKRAVKAGFLLKPDAALIKKATAASAIGG